MNMHIFMNTFGSRSISLKDAGTVFWHGPVDCTY